MSAEAVFCFYWLPNFRWFVEPLKENKTEIAAINVYIKLRFKQSKQLLGKKAVLDGDGGKGGKN